MTDGAAYAGGKAVALVSGGLDSVVSLAIADRDMEIRLVLFCNYGQRALPRERASVIDVAGYYGLPFCEIDLTWLRDLSPPGMRGSLAGAGPGTGLEPSPGASDGLASLEDVWVANRNGVFVNAAAAFAERYGCAWVVTGFNREEAEEFPDNTPEFVEALNRSLAFSTLSGVRVVSFTQGLSKRQILAKGVEMSVPLGLIWSCYRDGSAMCGDCASCRRLKSALASLPEDRRPVIEFSQ
jgi:7-cyano-7-deazaguanine synthase